MTELKEPRWECVWCGELLEIKEIAKDHKCPKCGCVSFKTFKEVRTHA